MDVLNQLFSTFKVQTQVFHNGQYCGNWAVDISGSHYISFHVVSYGDCFLRLSGSDKTEILNAGDMVMFPRDNSHCLTSDPDFNQPVNALESESFNDGPKEGATGLVCGYFTHQHPLITSITGFLPDHLIIRATDDKAAGVSLIAQALLDESRNPAKGSPLILAKLSESILAMVLRDHLPESQGVLGALVHPKLHFALEAIHDNPAQKWTVDALAEKCFMSRASFSDLFKQVVGQSPMDYVTQWRLSLAYRMLADENITTLHAAQNVGYENESSFSKAFKRVMGVTPGAVRNNS